MKLSDAIQGFWLTKRSQVAKTTYASYCNRFKSFVTFLDDKDIEQVSPLDVKNFFTYLLDERKLSRRSVHDSWIILSSLWTWAEQELGVTHVLRENKIKPLKFQQKIIEPFSEEEIKALVAGAGYTNYVRNGRNVRMKRATGARDTAVLLVLIDSGIRASELCSLLASDFDKDRGRLHIRHGKGDKDRFVFLGDRAQKAIWRFMIRKKHEKPGDPLFPTKTGQQMDRTNLRHLIQIIAERVGVKGAHPHRFRHTYAISFLRNGGNVAELQRILGHSSIEMSLHYAKLAEVDIERAGKSYSPADNWKL